MRTRINVQLKFYGDTLNFEFYDFYEVKDFTEQALSHFVKNEYQERHTNEKFKVTFNVELVEDDELDELLEEILSDFDTEEKKEEVNEPL